MITFLFTSLKKICAIIGYRSTYTSFYFQKCLSNCENLIKSVLFYVLNWSIYKSIIDEILFLIFGVLVFVRFLCCLICYLSSFSEYRLDNCCS